jgi:hypothetical protein
MSSFFHQQHLFISFFPLVHVCLTFPLPLATPKEPTPKSLAKSVTETHLDLTIYNSCEGLFFQILRQVKINGLGRQISPYIHEGRTILSGGLKIWNGSSRAHTIDMHTVQIMTACVGN